jgi:hypothetical protein
LDVALLANDEIELIKNVGDCLPTDNSVAWGLVDKKNIKKLWTFCKQAAPASAAGPGVPNITVSQDNEEASLPEGVPEAIEAAWVKKHNFHLPGSRMLRGGDYNRVYNCLNKKKPVELPQMNPEKFRLQSEGVTGESKGLFLSEDGTVTSQKKFFCEIVAHDMLWWKARAYLYTVCYLTILRPDFFPLQACENFVDAIHDVILAPTASGGRLTLVQCKVAWTAMISAMQVRIHQASCTLQALTENDMFWKHHWAWHSGSGSAPSGAAPSDKPTNQERRLQSLADKAANAWGSWGGGGDGGGGQKRGGPGGGGRQRGNRGTGKKGNGNGNGNKNFNANVPPPPNGGKGDRGKNAGQKAFNKRAKKGGQGK